MKKIFLMDISAAKKLMAVSDEFFDLIRESFGREVVWQPMNRETAFFHASEPCHLSFGKLVYGDFEA